jgi:hypothetical protein
MTSFAEPTTKFALPSSDCIVERVPRKATLFSKFGPEKWPEN